MTEKKVPAPFSENVKWIFLVTILSYGTWGIVDPLYSIYLSEILDKNYFLVGLAFGVRSLVSLLAVFFFARILKRMSAPQGLFIASVISTLVAFGFFLAGIFSSPVIIFIICALNGISVMLSQTSKQNFLMAESNASNASSVLGNNVAFKYSSWGVGMLIGGAVLYYFQESIQIEYMYLSVAFILSLHLFIYKKYFKEFKTLTTKDIKKDIKTVLIKDKVCLHLFSKMKKFSSSLNFSIILFFFMELTSRVVMLFIPLLAIDMNLELWQVFMLMAFMMMPMLLTFLFSKWADKYDRFTMVIIGIVSSLLPLGFLMIVSHGIHIAISSALISVCLAFLQPAVLGISGSLAPEKEKSSIAELELFFATLGAIVGGMGIGAVASAFGIKAAFGVITVFAVLFLIIALLVRHHVIKNTKEDAHNEDMHHHRKIYELTHFHFRRHYS